MNRLFWRAALAPTAHRVPVYPMVSITFLCRACTAQPIPPLDPYVRLSPHTAHDRGILRERSISPTPRYILHGQLCAFVGYLCTVSLPSPSGPSPCTRLSRIRTTMPYLTACRASELSVRVSPAYFPLSLTSLSGSPVFRMKDSNEMM